MAMNGIAEAYVFSKGSSDTLKVLRQLMMINSISYIAMSYLFSQTFGIIGLVYANCFNMLARSSSCIYFAQQHLLAETTGKLKSDMSFTQGVKKTVIFYFEVFSGKIYLGLTVLALIACKVLQLAVIPIVMKKLGIRLGLQEDVID